MSDYANNARKHLVNLVHKNQSPHIASSLSMIDFVTVIIQRSLERAKQNEFQDDFVLSKGHAAAGFYSVLKAFNLISDGDFETFYENGSNFYGHISHKASEWNLLTTGSLGHGLPFSVGLALANKIHGKVNQESLVVMSDGECDEGSVWESALIAGHHRLNNLKVIIDRNYLQSLTDTESTLALEPLADKWRAFGWEVIAIDGHDPAVILDALNTMSSKPLCIIAHTIKGKGVSFMENSVVWHYKAPNLDEYILAKKELSSE
jgi:transketolase